MSINYKLNESALPYLKTHTHTHTLEHTYVHTPDHSLPLAHTHAYIVDTCTYIKNTC